WSCNRPTDCTGRPAQYNDGLRSRLSDIMEVHLMKILVVEDDAETSSYLINGLQEFGHTVDGALNGRDGLFLATGGQHDVVIVDRMLPGLDGLSMVRAMRSAGMK